MTEERSRRFCVGAEWCGPSTGVDFRIWAPKRSGVEVVVEGAVSPLRLDDDGGGYFRGASTAIRVGDRYRIRLDGDARLFPDPASRSQPEGPHGPSEVVDGSAFEWTDAAWKGTTRDGQVIYELHLGTFSRAGTWAGACAELPELAQLGITLVEIMPIAEFPGKFGWGYDGVDIFAPSHLYGTPDDARRFMNAAHALGIGVILDVVYNHFGPDGNYLSEFADSYFTDRHKTDWGAAINFHDEGSSGVRELVLANARYWIEEFHFDGLRLDATQNIYDDSRDHILAAITRTVRRAAGHRRTFVVAENESQEAMMARSTEKGGYGMDALWNDDFHHCAAVALTGKAEAYYSDYAGTPQEFISAAKWGYLYQGQHYMWQKQRRGRPALDLEPDQFVSFLENHDQVANSFRGERMHKRTSPGRHRALVALVLLGPATPLLFQGEEFGSSAPFQFFADHGVDLGELVRDGRRQFLAQFPSMTVPGVPDLLPIPGDVSTFERCKLDFAERKTNASTYAFYRDLIALRHSDPVFGAPRARGVDGAVLSTQAFVLLFFGSTSAQDRLVVVNLGADVVLARAPEPLLAPTEGTEWRELWSSENPRYGGGGSPPLERGGIWHVPGEAAVALALAKVAS